MTGASALAPGPARDTILLGKYRVETVLGFGGAGLVIKARHLGLDEYVAIKLMRDDIEVDAEQMQRFLREAKAAVRLKSEHVAKIQDVGTLEDGRPYMVMELLEGMDLGQMIVDQERIEATLAVDLVLQACDALAEAHSLGIVHRDVKPTNLFVARRRDGSALVKVLDFGISKGAAGIDMSLTQTSSVLGTPAYMSPEQMRSARTVDARTDIWSLGTVLYEMIEGVLPFDANNFAELCVKVATEEPRPMQVAPQLGAVIGRCLAKSADERFASIAEVAQALVPFASDQEQALRAVTKMTRMLGRATPWPDPPSRPSNPRLDPSEPRPRQSRMSSAIPTVYRPRKGSTAVTVAAFLGLIGLGVGAGMWYALGRGGGAGSAAAVRGSAAEHAPAVGSGTSDLGPRTSDPGEKASPDAPKPAAAIDSDEEPDAITQAGSAVPVPREVTIRRPPKRQPAQQVSRPPKRQPINAGAGEPPPAPPPKPPCNPFDAKDSC